MQRFKNILVVAGLDGATAALAARAKWLAEANGAKLTLIDVVDSAPGEFARLLSALPGARAREVEAQVVEMRKEDLEKVATDLREAGQDVTTVLAQGVGFIEVIRHVLAHDNDLVLKAADQDLSGPLLGGPDLHLLRKCPCPVWLLNSAAEPASRRIVAAVDPDPDDAIRDALNQKVMQLATSLARQDDARLDVVNAWYLYEEPMLRSSRLKTPESEINALLAKVERESAARLVQLTDAYSDFADIMDVIHIKGSPPDVISEHTEHARADILVMGTLGRTGLKGLFIGNTAETVLNRVKCSVLAVKPEGFNSPVTLDDTGAGQGTT